MCRERYQKAWWTCVYSNKEHYKFDGLWNLGEGVGLIVFSVNIVVHSISLTWSFVKSIQCKREYQDAYGRKETLLALPTIKNRQNKKAQAKPSRKGPKPPPIDKLGMHTMTNCRSSMNIYCHDDDSEGNMHHHMFGQVMANVPTHYIMYVALSSRGFGYDNGKILYMD